MHSPANAALPDRVRDLLGRGCSLIPLQWVTEDGCSCRKESCPGPGKHPIFSDWQTKASSDVKVAGQWQKRWPQCNWGWVQGRDNLALDLDRKSGKDGIATLRQLEAEHEPLPRTICAATPTGGGHLILRVPTEAPLLCPATDWWPGIDVRTENSYIVVEPSTTDKGSYRFWRFEEASVCPAWLLEMLPLAEDASEHTAAFVLNEAAELPAAAASLLDEDEGFRELWERTSDKRGDQSSSAWDFSLALRFVRSQECSDQDLADLICAYRREHDGWGHRGSQKRRTDYLRRTIGAVRQAHDDEDLSKLIVEDFPATSAATRPKEDPWPEPPGSDAFHGLPCRLVDLITPFVESDPASILVQFLTAFGIAVGIRPHFMVGATRHPPATYIGLVGQTSRARKGTSWDPIESLFRQADSQFAARIMSGIGSGERLVGLVADPPDEVTHVDRRLLLQEPELARMLTAINREGSTLSAYLRAAYDGKPLRNEVKKDKASSSIHLIGIIGHSTAEELRDQLKEDQIRNGLANRIAWFLTRRTQLLPDPPTFEGPDIEEAVAELRAKRDAAAALQRLQRSSAAQRAWADWYSDLGDDDLGVTGAIMARAEAQVIRFSIIYALTDASATIELEHFRAAVALWDYSMRCVTLIWGRETGDPIADQILEELAYGPLTKSQISKEVFSGNLAAPYLTRAGRMLERRGRIVRERRPLSGRGRPPEVWRLK